MGMSLLKFRWRSKEITVLFGPAGPVFYILLLGSLCRKVPASPLDCRFSHRRARYFLLHQRKYPKSVSRGRAPWIPPAQLHCALLFPASWTRGCAGSPGALRASASVCFGYPTPPGRLAGLGPPAWRTVRGADRRLEHQEQAPIGGAGVSQVTCAKGRGPPWVGYVSMTDAGQ